MQKLLITLLLTNLLFPPLNIKGAENVTLLDAHTASLKNSLWIHIPRQNNDRQIDEVQYSPFSLDSIDASIDEYWVKFTVVSKYKQDFPYLISTFYFDSLQLFLDMNDSIVRKGNKNGNIIPHWERDFDHFHTSLVPIYPKYGVEETYYMKLYASTKGSRTSANTSFRIGFYAYGEKGYEAHHLFPHYFNVFILGALLLVSFYNIGIYVVLRKNAFAFLSLYNIAAMLWVIAFGGFFIVPLGVDDLELERVMRQALSFPPLVLSYLLLTIKFLDTKKLNKTLHYCLLASAIVPFFIGYLYFNSDFSKGNYIGILMFFPFYLQPIAASIIAIKKKVKGSSVFLSATVVMLFAVTILSIGFLFEDFNYLTGHRIYQISIFIEIIIFSIAGTQVVLSERQEKEKLRILYEAKEEDIALRKKELTTLMETINQKNIEIAATNEDKTDSKVASKNVIEINTDKEWETFRNNFELLFTTFSERLSENHPNLTQNDQRICALIKTGMKNKQIAELQGISIKSIEKSKERIKKKMDLDREMSLNEYLDQLDKD